MAQPYMYIKSFNPFMLNVKGTLAKSGDQDQTLQNAVSDQDLHYLPIKDILVCLLKT